MTIYIKRKQREDFCFGYVSEIAVSSTFIYAKTSFRKSEDIIFFTFWICTVHISVEWIVLSGYDIQISITLDGRYSRLQ